MKIGIIAHLKHPIVAPFAGGLEVFTHQVTKSLQALGHEVILFASDASDQTLPLEPIYSDEHYDKKTKVRKKQKDLPSEYIAEHHAYFNLMMHIDDYELDVIFNNSLHYIPITMAATLETSMITVLHTPPFYELKMAIEAERRQPVIDYITVSQQNARNWSDVVSDCAVILNGIKLAEWPFNPSTTIAKHALWFGRIHPDKGLHLAIAAARTAGIPLHVAGGIADQKYFDKEIKPILGEDIKLLGLLNHEQLSKEICQASACLITPCWEEPFGFVVAEAMACGTPIAGFKMGALPELVAPETGILVDFGDTEALADALKNVTKLDRKYIHQYANEKFSFDKMMANYVRFMEEVADKKKNLKYAG